MCKLYLHKNEQNEILCKYYLHNVKKRAEMCKVNRKTCAKERILRTHFRRLRCVYWTSGMLIYRCQVSCNRGTEVELEEKIKVYYKGNKNA